MKGPALIPSPQDNRLIGALDAQAKERLLPFLEVVYLSPAEVLHESGEALHHAYFPIDSIVALVCELESGSSAEISIVGNEGLIGTALFMGGGSTPRRAVVLCGGYAYRLGDHRLKAEFIRHSTFMRLLLRYVQLLMAQVAQTAACNRHHSVDQRLSCCLLHCLDHGSGNQMIMSQEVIANLLGVRRESVTAAAGKLKKLGVIDYRRGHISVLARSGLEEQSCECYVAVKHEAFRLLRNLPLAVLEAPRTDLNRGHIAVRPEVRSSIDTTKWAEHSCSEAASRPFRQRA